MIRTVLACMFAGMMATSASALSCSTVDDAKRRVDAAQTKEDVVNALRLLQPVSDDHARGIYGSYTDADSLRDKAREWVEKTRPTCTK